MERSNQPAKIQLPWAQNAGASYVRVVPVPSQIGIANGRSSWNDGFPPLTFVPDSAGGVPPYGDDANGALKQISAGEQWIQAGGPLPYDSVFSSSIGGYPQGALIPDATALGIYWLSLVDNNTSDPAALSGAWQTVALVATTAAGPTVKLTANLAAAGASVTFTADEIGVATSLGGPGLTIAELDQVLDVSTTGANGMDTGLAPASGFVSIYAICNPRTGDIGLLGTTASQSTIYGGANMPVGYTMSALVSIWPTDASRLLVPGSQIDREFFLEFLTLPGQTVLSLGTATTPTSVSLSAVVPAAARVVYISCAVTDTSVIDANSAAKIGATSSVNQLFVGVQIANRQLEQQAWIPIITPQVIYYLSGDSTVETSIQVLGYKI